MKFKSAAIAAMAAALVACGGGTQDFVSDTHTLKPDDYDFVYVSDTSAMNRNSTHTATFKWDGADGPVGTQQHAVLAFVHGRNPAYINAAGEALFTHGVGVLVGEHGLGLEAWFQDEGSNAIVRTQATGGATYVRSGNEAYVYSYITPADFTLSRDVVYTLHLTVIPEGHVTRVLGELWDESGMLQHGTLHVMTAMHLGVVGRAVLARTPGESGDSIQATYLGGK